MARCETDQVQATVTFLRPAGVEGRVVMTQAMRDELSAGIANALLDWADEHVRGMRVEVTIPVVVRPR